MPAAKRRRVETLSRMGTPRAAKAKAGVKGNASIKAFTSIVKAEDIGGRGLAAKIKKENLIAVVETEDVAWLPLEPVVGDEKTIAAPSTAQGVLITSSTVQLRSSRGKAASPSPSSLKESSPASRPIRRASSAAKKSTSKANATDPHSPIKTLKSSPDDTSTTTPSKQQSAALHLSASITPTKGASAILSALALSTPSSSPRKRSLAEADEINTIAQSRSQPIESPIDTSSDSPLPAEVTSFLALSSSFLTALSLYIAHHGSASPADLRTLLPSVARVWGRRAVTVLDARRVVGLMDAGAGVKVVSYGGGRVCVETEGDRVGAEEERLMRGIDEKIRELWGQWEGEAQRFVEGLPLAVVKVIGGGETKPVLAKGQSRLEDFRIGVKERKQREGQVGKMVKAKIGEKKSLDDRKQDLLERMQAKALKQTTLDLLSSKHANDRAFAGHKMLEVAAVIRMLSGSSPSDSSGSTLLKPSSSAPGRPGPIRTSLPFPALLQHVQNSTRFPASREEVSRCIKLVAELAPEWVRVVTVGEVQAVVVSREKRIGNAELRERFGANATVG
ncbi:MAG: hypothetical protein M1814_001204 [Vezdaea aestivalis]|nr:MAG: hypothetical protein M1814_001204 [Vezdaea aestivalis]